MINIGKSRTIEFEGLRLDFQKSGRHRRHTEPGMESYLQIHKEGYLAAMVSSIEL